MAWLKVDVTKQLKGIIPAANLPSVTLTSFADAEAPAGIIDGVNTVFTLTNAPSPAASLQLYCGIPPLTYIMRGGVDYTLDVPTGMIITFTTPPLIGSEILAWYRY